MIGVLVNAAAVVLGSVIGVLFKKGIPERVSQAAMVGLGICTLFIGISGGLVGENVLIMISSVVLGGIIGTLLNIDTAANRLARKVEETLRKPGQNTTLAEGFVSATLLFCVGSMAVTGPLQSGLMGDNSVLFTKAMLDMVAALMLGASLGVGVVFSSVSILLFEGSIVLLAKVLSPLLSTGAVNEMTCVGSILIMMIGTNLMGVTKIKVADFLPAILLAPVIYNVLSLFS